MICPKCGAFLNDDARFCSYCGEKVNIQKPASERMSVKETSERPVLSDRPRDEDFDITPPVRSKKRDDEVRPPKQNPLVILLIILTGLFIVIVGMLVFEELKSHQRTIVNIATGEAGQSVKPPTSSKEEETEKEAAVITVSESESETAEESTSYMIEEKTKSTKDSGEAEEESETSKEEGGNDPSEETAEENTASEEEQETSGETVSEVVTVPDPSTIPDESGSQAGESGESQSEASEESASETIDTSAEVSETVADITETAEAYSYEVAGIIYRFENGTATLLKCYSADAVMELPQEADGFPIVSIGPHAFDGCEHLTHIDLPEGITSIQDGAFNNCMNLLEVVFPTTMYYAAEDAFTGVYDLTIVSENGTYGYQYAMSHGLKFIEGSQVSPAIR